ncbi:MAG: Dipeptidyl-peptidase 5 [Ignavibacteriaceae bacterium]|nr:Dipeptidyl-peptidase 5 [Ignavibacteriaceae bacterium]
MYKLLSFFLFLSVMMNAQNGRQLNFDDLWAMQRIGTADLSPDGSKITFALTSFSYDLNKGNSDVYVINTDGTGLKALKNTEKGESGPKFSPDGKKIAYVTGNQIWLTNADGSGEEQITTHHTGASGVVWSQDGKKMLFVSSVYPDCADQECNKKKDEDAENSKVKASVFTELMYRHWDDWRGDKRSHLFLLDLATKEITDLTPFSKFDVPPIALGSAKDYTFSPDGNWVAFTMNTDEVLATSTNNDIFLLDLRTLQKGKKPEHKKISLSKGNDNQPVFSPDGKLLAYTSMERAGFEADRLRLMIYDVESGKTRQLFPKQDISVSEFIWSPDGKLIYFTAAKEIYESVYRVSLSGDKAEVIIEKHMSSNLMISPDGTKLYFKQQKSTQPHEFFSADADGKNVKQISFINAERLKDVVMNEVETFWVKGAGGTPVQSIMVKPPFFDETQKYPMIFLIHGGPQGHWSDDFHYRWNIQMFAADGYVVIAPNPRGSTGYGQKFTDEISGDWAGKVYTDLMNVYDEAVKKYKFIDKKNTFAAGASYGGYMINWIAGHTDRFNALVSHAGVFNLESMFGTTEELWFPEWEFKGTPWQNRKMYEKWSPHRYIHNCKTPVLVVHGAKDFRVTEDQAFQLYTSLQRLGVPSKFLYFPDETHFVAKPQNSRLWWKTVLDWFDKNKKL